MCNGLPRTTLSYSGDALRSFNVQPTSQLRRDVRKRLFSLRIWSPRYKHLNKGNSNVKQSFDHSVTVRKSVPGVKLGVINCQSISGKLDFVFDHIKEYQLDIVALTETWLSSEDSKNKHVIDQCVAHGYSLHHSPRTSGQYDESLSSLLDKHAPSKRIYVVERPMNDWMTDDILVLKALRRKYESLWRKTHLTVHFDMYSESCMDVKTAISNSKSEILQKRQYQTAMVIRKKLSKLLTPC